jgi:hypothetical protein
MRIASTLWSGSEGCSEKLHRKEGLHKCLLNVAVLPPALLIGDESTLAPSRTNTHQESRARTKRRAQNRTKRTARHRSIGDGSFPFAPRVQTASSISRGLPRKPSVRHTLQHLASPRQFLPLPPPRILIGSDELDTSLCLYAAVGRNRIPLLRILAAPFALEHTCLRA